MNPPINGSTPLPTSGIGSSAPGPFPGPSSAARAASGGPPNDQTGSKTQAFMATAGGNHASVILSLT